jgi:CspA family cold shock protein
MATGQVKFFNTDKGFGFIVPDDGGKDVFVHVKDLSKSGIEFLSKDQQVSYETKENQGKVIAVNIRIITP